MDDGQIKYTFLNNKCFFFTEVFIVYIILTRFELRQLIYRYFSSLHMNLIQVHLMVFLLQYVEEVIDIFCVKCYDFSYRSHATLTLHILSINLND